MEQEVIGNSESTQNAINMDIQSSLNTDKPTSQDTSTVSNKVKDEYNYRDSGPYIIILQGQNQNLTKLHPIKIGKLLFDHNVDSIVQVKKAGPNKFEIQFQNYSAANRFLQSNFDQLHNTISFIPKYYVYSKGIVKNIDTDITCEEIMEQGSTPEQYKIAHIRHFHKKLFGTIPQNGFL